MVSFILQRVLGAIIIVAGLYLVVWGKSKDYKSSLELVDEQPALPTLMEDRGNKGRKESDHEVITIHATEEGK